MKTTKPIKYTSLPPQETPVLREISSVPAIGQVISVRAAKAHLSALLELVAGGQEVTITSDGEPKARLVGLTVAKSRNVFTGMGDFLLKQPIQRGGPTADEIIRADRDARP